MFVNPSPNLSNYSNPYLLGQASADLKSGDNSVAINLVANFTNSTKVGECQFAGQPGGGSSSADSYGTGLDGTVTIDGTLVAGTGTYTDGGGQTRVFNASRRLKEISSVDPNLIELHSPYSSTGTIDYRVGDEVMWWVVSANKPGGPDLACKTNGESDISRGRYGFTRVIGTPDSTHLKLESVLFSNPNNANLAASTNSAEFCGIQIVRIPNFDELRISDSTGTTLEASNYNSTSVEGGMLAFRAKTRINMVNKL